MAAVLFTLIWTGRLAAQTIPNEPSDFTAYFTALNIPLYPGAGTASRFEAGSGFQNFGPADALGFQNVLLSYPGTEQNDDLFMDYTRKRERIDFGYLIPANAENNLVQTPQLTVWIFYDKQLEYVYDQTTKVCSKTDTDFTTPITPFWEFLTQSEASSGSTNLAQIWKYQLDPLDEIEFGNIVDTAQTPLFLLWRSPQGITTLTFDIFKSGAPDSSVFNLPPACNQ